MESLFYSNFFAFNEKKNEKMYKHATEDSRKNLLRAKI